MRLPVELLEWVKTQPGSKADVIAAALTHRRDGITAPPEAAGDIAALEAALVRVADLEAMLAARDLALDTVTRDRDQWRDRAKAIVNAGANKEPTNAVATKTIGRHAAGPVLEPRLKVSGTAQPFFRPGTTADKASKSGG